MEMTECTYATFMLFYGLIKYFAENFLLLDAIISSENVVCDTEVITKCS